MKKIVAILIALTVIFAFAASCSTSGPSGPVTSPSASPSGPVTSPSAAPSDTGTPSAAPSPSGPVTSPSATAGSNDDWAYIQNKGTLVIGYTDYAPMNYTDDSGQLVGFDTEFAKAVCAKLGLTPDFQLINWDTKEIELAAGSIDCIWNGLTVTEDRKENMAFTESYLKNQQVVVVKASNADQYTDVSSLEGKALVAEAGSAGEAAILAAIPDDPNYTPVDAQANALLEVKAGTADAAVIDLTMARSMTGPNSDYTDLTFVQTIQMQPEEYAIGFRLGSTALDPINAVITQLMNDGTLAALADKYELTDLLITK